MKISISYPPLKSEKGTPLLGQNRQFQWFSSPTYIYPMVPASAATLLAHNGYEVIWDDAIAEKKTFDEWFSGFKKENPDLIAIETKTPVIKKHWKIIEKIKKWNPKIKVVLMGDHVTAFPLESFKNSAVDFVITSGDYDFLLLNLVKYLEGKEDLEGGIYFREITKNGIQIKNSGPAELRKHDLNRLPFINRDLTKWELYAYENGNYKKTPGTYTMVGRDCWWGRCTFCSWTTLFPGDKFRTRTPESLLDEIGMLIEKYEIKEIMDDTGTFPVGGWLERFCKGMIERGYNKKVVIDCNMRLNALTPELAKLMGKAGFRFILYGLESANQKTLDKINKNLKVEDIEKGVRIAKEGGLEPHITVMMGYPWESKEDAERTVALAKKVFRKGYVDSLQATIVIPYPGAPLFEECRKKGWLKTLDWDRYDMREAIMKSPLTEEDVKKYTKQLYKVFLTPRFIMRKFMSIRNFNDIKFIARAGFKVVGHLLDFSTKTKK
jgi:radical SAM superfamily enzyme YgiQ (UPF0313 family)